MTQKTYLQNGTFTPSKENKNMKTTKQNEKEIIKITDTLYYLYNNKEITEKEYAKSCNNLSFLVARYCNYKNIGITIKPKNLIIEFLNT